MLIIPQLKGAPAVPLIVDLNGNSVTAQDVADLQRRILAHVARRGLRGRVFIDIADGDSRLRQRSFDLHDHPGDLTDYYTICHPCVPLRLPLVRWFWIHCNVH